MNHPQLNHLKNRIEELLSLCSHLAEENQLLRTSQAELLSERERLLEKNDLARQRIEAMIDRLQAMEMDNDE